LGRKFPHTTAQIGYFPPNYDPLTKYRRMISPLEGYYSKGIGVEEILNKTMKIAQNASVKNFGSFQNLRTLINKTLKQDIIGLYFTGQWAQEAVDAEMLFRNMPELLANEFLKMGVSPEETAQRVSAVKNLLSDPTARDYIKSKYNRGLRSERLDVGEDILKKAINNPDDVEALALDYSLSLQDRILRHRNQVDTKYTLQERFEFAQTMTHLNETDRLLFITGLFSPNLETKKPFFPKRPFEVKNIVKEGKVTTAVGERKSLMRSLIDVGFFETSRREGQADEGFLITGNMFDKKGRLARRPIAGKIPAEAWELETGHYIRPGFVTNGTTTTRFDPLELLENNFEREVIRELGEDSNVSLYGIGELKDKFSL
jgi:hypothetical protein